MTPKYKVTRARSEEKKKEQFERILEIGKELFTKKGIGGFSMRNLAQKLDMTKNNLYNYVESKRELWIAIRNKFYKQFKEENIEIIKRYNNEPRIKLFMKICEHFFEFAERDFDVFILMHAFTSAPKSNKLGKFEKKYREYRLLDGTARIIQEMIDRGEIKETDPGKAALFLYAVLFGAMYIDMNRRIEIPILENIQMSIKNISSKDFQNYVLEMIEKVLKNNLL